MYRIVLRNTILRSFTHIYINVFTEHMPCTRHYSLCWKYRDEQDCRTPSLMGVSGGEVINKQINEQKFQIVVSALFCRDIK